MWYPYRTVGLYVRWEVTQSGWVILFVSTGLSSDLQYLLIEAGEGVLVIKWERNQNSI